MRAKRKATNWTFITYSHILPIMRESGRVDSHMDSVELFMTTGLSTKAASIKALPIAIKLCLSEKIAVFIVDR